MAMACSSCSDTVKPPALKLQGNTVCAGPKVEDSPGAGATIHVTFVYAIYWCEGTVPEEEAARTSQLERALGQFECDGLAPIHCTSRDAEAHVYTVDEYRRFFGHGPLPLSTQQVEYIIVINPA
jgi:hypothetical protein